MKRIWTLILCLTLLVPLSGFAKAPEVATYPPSALGGQYGIFITGPGREPEAITASHPMPVQVVGSFTTSGGSTSGSVNNLASDSQGNLKINIASVTGQIHSTITSGLLLETIAQVATNSSTILANITSGTAAPFWVTIRNVGLTTIHYSPGTPTDSSDGIAPGEQIAMYVGTNTPALNLRAHSTGISTSTINIWK